MKGYLYGTKSLKEAEDAIDQLFLVPFPVSVRQWNQKELSITGCVGQVTVGGPFICKSEKYRDMLYNVNRRAGPSHVNHPSTLCSSLSFIGTSVS